MGPPVDQWQLTLNNQMLAVLLKDYTQQESCNCLYISFFFTHLLLNLTIKNKIMKHYVY